MASALKVSQSDPASSRHLMPPPTEIPDRPGSPNMLERHNSHPLPTHASPIRDSSDSKRTKQEAQEAKAKKFMEKMMKQFTSVEELIDRKDCKALLDWAGSLSKHAKNLSKEGKGMEQVADKLFHLAEQNYEQAMKLEPKNKRVFFDWGKTLLRLGTFLEKRRNLAEAFRQFKQASGLFQFGLEIETTGPDGKILKFWMKAIEKIAYFRPSDKSIGPIVDAFLQAFHTIALQPDAELETLNLEAVAKITLSENKYVKNKGIVALRKLVPELPKGQFQEEAAALLKTLEATLEQRDSKPTLKYEELPDECKQLVLKSGLTTEEITQKGNFDVFLNCLWFENQKLKRRTPQPAAAATGTPDTPAAKPKPHSQPLLYNPLAPKGQYDLHKFGMVTALGVAAAATPSTPPSNIPVNARPSMDTINKRPSLPSLPLSTIKGHQMDTTKPPASPRGQLIDSSVDTKDLFVHKNPQNLFRSFLQIGQGAYGEVYTARHTKNDEQVAIKVMHVKNSRDMKHICNEIFLLKSCTHPNIVQYIESYYYDYTVWMVMKYYNGGTLQHLLRNVELAEHEIRSISRQVLEGLKYLHHKNLVHRDIKSENILLSSEGVIAIADLGFCAQLLTALESTMPISGSSYWIAPEMLRHEPYGSKVDIWSFGCVLVEMAERRPPYGEYRALKAIYYTATKGAPKLKNPAKFSDGFRDVLELALQFDQDNRPSAEELLKHRYFADEPSKDGEKKEFVKGHRRTRSAY